jgi:PatG Domain
MEVELNQVPTEPESGSSRGIVPQVCSRCGAAACSCGVNAAQPSGWIYAIGKVEARFPTLAVEKEYAQILGREQSNGLTDRQAMHAVVSRAQNRYLTRQLCWVMTIEGLETYLLYPQDPADLSLLIEAIRPNPSPTDLDVVIGKKGPLASPATCNGLTVPMVTFDQIYSFDRDALIQSIPKPDSLSAEEFAPAAAELFDRIMFMADNAGASDEHRALNYLTMRYPAIYATAAAAFGRNASIDSVDVNQSPLAGTRNILEVIFSFRNRSTDVVEKFFTRVDVTERFPFLVTKMSPYYDR